MRKYLPLIAAVTIIHGSGCIKPTTNSNPNTSNSPLNATGFAVTAPANYAPGGIVTIGLTAPKLTDGVYNFSYSLSGQSYGGGNYNVNVTFNGGKGSFQTPTLPTSAGCITLNSNAIYDLSHTNMASVYGVATICDSSGVMDAMYNNTKFYTSHISVSLNGSTLQISGTVYDGASSYDPGKTIQLTMQNFSQSPKTVSFTQADYYDKGYANYHSSTNNQNAAYGKISITATSPILTGNFSFTAMDSSKFSGTFSVAAP